MKKLLVASLLLFSHAAFAEDIYTPVKIKQNSAIDPVLDPSGYASQVAYVNGVISSILTVQNAAITGKYVCQPLTGLTAQNVKEAFAAMDPTTYANNNDGGVVYIFSALAAKFPCAK